MPDESIPHPDDLGISWSEMVVSFMVHSGVILPLKRSRPSGVEYLQTFDSWDAALTFQVGLSELAHTFSNLVLQIRKLHAYDPWPQRPLGFVRSLYQLGSAHQPAGVKTRPVFPPPKAGVYAFAHLFVGKSRLDNLLQMEQPVTRVDVNPYVSNMARGAQACSTWFSIGTRVEAHSLENLLFLHNGCNFDLVHSTAAAVFLSPDMRITFWSLWAIPLLLGSTWVALAWSRLACFYFSLFVTILLTPWTPPSTRLGGGS